MATIKVISARTAALTLSLTAIAAYVNAFYGTFQFDDFAALQDRRLTSVSAFLGHLDQTIRPMLKLSLVIDRRLYGESPAGYHVLNLLLHCGCGLLLFAILTYTLRRASLPNPQVFATVPFWTAFLFLVHPLATETVTYISGRANGLAAFFSLLALYLFLRSTDPGIPQRIFLLTYGGSIASFILALLAKEVAVVFPCAVLVWYVVFEPQALDRRCVRLQMPLWIVLILLLAAACLHPQYVYLARASLQARPLYDNLLTQANAVAYSLSLFFLPHRLNFDHDLPVYRSILLWPPALSLALLAGMLAVALRSIRKAPFFSFGVLWFFLCILPTNSLVPRYDILSERNLYLPSIGILLAAVSLGAQAGSKFRTAWPNIFPGVARFVCVLVVVGLFTATVGRNRIYADQVTFWSDAVRKSPQKARPHNNLGYACVQAGDLDRALDEFRAALALDGDYATAQRNLLETWTLKQRQAGRPKP